MNSKDFKRITRELCKRLINLENTQCVICHEEIKVGTLLLPCVHYEICMACSAVMDDSCPLCRIKTERVVHYYKKDEYSNNIYNITEAINYDKIASQYRTSSNKN